MVSRKAIKEKSVILQSRYFSLPTIIFEKRTFPFHKDIQQRVTAHQYPLRSNTWAVRITSEAEEPARVRRVVA